MKVSARAHRNALPAGSYLSAKPPMGRKAEQRRLRAKRVALLYNFLHDYMLVDGVWDTVENTGLLIPRGNLKRVKNIRLFAGLFRMFDEARPQPGQARVFTTRVCRQALRKLVFKLQLDPAKKGSMVDWVNTQATRLQQVGARVRRSSVAARLAKDAMTAEEETQQYDVLEVPWQQAQTFCLRCLQVAALAFDKNKENLWGDTKAWGMRCNHGNPDFHCW